MIGTALPFEASSTSVLGKAQEERDRTRQEDPIWGVEPKIGGSKKPKMDGENNGSKPY